jgi:predicted HAD superfamily Cof-like phosphohydrolase
VRAGAQHRRGLIIEEVAEERRDAAPQEGAAADSVAATHALLTQAHALQSALGTGAASSDGERQRAAAGPDNKEAEVRILPGMAGARRGG